MSSQNVSDSAFDMTMMRRNMVDSQLRPSNVSDPVVVGAMAVTPREAFVPDAQRAIAYMDRAIPLGSGRVLNPPLSTGLLLDRADIASFDRVLLIGAATGYCAALLATIVASVVAVEEDSTLIAHARAALASSANVTLVEAPLDQGFADGGPYSLIIIDGAVEKLPDSLIALVSQLHRGGPTTTVTTRNPAATPSLIFFAFFFLAARIAAAFIEASRGAAFSGIR